MSCSNHLYLDYENKSNECFTENKCDDVNSSKLKRKHVEESWNEPGKNIFMILFSVLP